MFWNRIANQNHFFRLHLLCHGLRNCSQTRRIQQVEIRKPVLAREREPCLYSLCNGYCIFCIASYICKNAHGGNDRFLCGKAGQRSCHRLPLAKAQRCKQRCDETTD